MLINIWLSAANIPGTRNTTADITSREFHEKKERSINSEIILLFFKTFAKKYADFFASQLNSKCSRYVSYKPDPYAYKTDALSLSWSSFKHYIFLILVKW